MRVVPITAAATGADCNPRIHCLIHDLLFLPISTIEWSELTCCNSLSHSRLACSRLSAHIQPSVNNPDTNGAANSVVVSMYNGHELS